MIVVIHKHKHGWYITVAISGEDDTVLPLIKCNPHMCEEGGGGGSTFFSSSFQAADATTLIDGCACGIVRNSYVGKV